ncbi:MAG: polysaccharide biosynthesis protein [Bacteroidia bacterium]|nr:polysaccharide biosynthesis protein [Bacteroidia bacterium]
MGIIRRQSIQSSLLFYIGAGIGFVSKVLIFTNFLTTQEVGLTNILVTNALLYAQFSAGGFATMTLKFFPYFQDKTRQHHYFLFWLLAIPTIGFVIVTALVLLFRDSIFEYFAAESPLMVEYFWYLIPMALATLYFDLFDSYLRSLLKTVVPILFREVVQRLLVAISILVYAAGWVTFPQFVALYVALICSVTILIVIYTFWLGHLHLYPRRSWRVKQLFRKILTYGGLTFMGNISAIVLYNIDGLMLAHYVGMDAVGIYTTSFYVSALIMIPWRAIQKIASPEVAAFWKRNDMKAMNKLYKRTSLINLGLGNYLFVMMVLGIPTLLQLMPGDYSQGVPVLIIIGVSRVFDMVTGLNTYILIMSKQYYIDLFLSIGVLVIGVALNLVLIPKYGIEGAAFATGLLIALANLMRTVFLWIKFNLNPFSGKMLSVLFATFVAIAAVYFIPEFTSPLLLFIIKGTIFSFVFAALILLLKAIPDADKALGLAKSKVLSYSNRK